MKITDLPVCNPYQKPGKWYHPVKNHSGEDRLFNYHTIEAPFSGVVLRIATQPEMGKCMYVADPRNYVHVFAHCSACLLGKGDSFRKGQDLFISGNTGTASSAPHVHHEIITDKPLNPEDKIMTRKLWEFSGYNTNPSKYLKTLQDIPEPDWISTKPGTPVKPHKPTYPIIIPDSVDLPFVENMYQGSTNACTVYSVVYGYHVQCLLANMNTILDPLETFKAVLTEKYNMYDPNKSLSYPEVFEWLIKYKYAKRFRKIQNTKEDWKIKLFQGYPVYTVINDAKQTHAICITGYTGDTFQYHDSLYRKTPFRTLDSLESVNTSYVLVL